MATDMDTMTTNQLKEHLKMLSQKELIDIFGELIVHYDSNPLSEDEKQIIK